MQTLFIQSLWMEGLSDDPRLPASAGFASSVNFDVSRQAGKMLPVNEWENVDDSDKELELLCQDGNDIYALGEVDGDIEIFRSTGSGTTMSPRITSTVGSATGFDSDYKLFNLYQGKIYGWDNGEDIFEFDVSTRVMTHQKFAPAVSGNLDTAPRGIIDQNRLYIPYNNYIGIINGTNWTPDSLVLPEDLEITAYAKWTKWHAIATVNDNGTADVYIWDGIATSFTTIIDFGFGRIDELQDLQGTLIAIVNQGSFTSEVRDTTIIKEYRGGAVQVFKEFEAVDGFRCHGSTVRDNRMFFATADGIWVIGKRDLKYPLSVSLYKKHISIDAGSNFFRTFDLMFVGSNLWIAGENNGNHRVEYVDARSGSADSAEVVSQKFDSGSFSDKKQLSEIIFSFEPLKDSAEIRGYYRVDSDSEDDWIQLFSATEEGTNQITLTTDMNGNDFKEYNEVEIKVQSDDGGVLTSWEGTGHVLNQNRK